MVRRFLLNAAIMTTPGVYEYRLLTPDEARAWAQAGEFRSFVGYPKLARLLEVFFNREVPLSRERIEYRPGDEALVARLRYRVGDPSSKREIEPSLSDLEFGLIRYVGGTE